ncbi:MAG TPA: hypothetical protein VNT26_17435 [Candidatus Sulfotelmatobacter sp.]|nr:hypothetical protein [Candidatus Sulfotelmatobacter sp.]HWI60055.1 hypothetical protein [Bacillota bacterium]
MNPVKLIEFFRARMKMVRYASYAILALLVLVDAIPGLIDKEHAHTKAEHWPAFWSVFGFVACVLIIILSKWYGHAGIMTREDYYDE